MRIAKTRDCSCIGLALSGGATLAVHAQEGPPHGAWQPNEPEGSWSHAWHSGFHDGMKPLATTSMPIGHPIPNRHDNFRHPDRPRDERGDFREASVAATRWSTTMTGITITTVPVSPLRLAAREPMLNRLPYSCPSSSSLPCRPGRLSSEIPQRPPALD